MTISRVYGPDKGTGTSSPLSVTLNNAPTSGNVLIACIAYTSNDGDVAVSGITQTNVTWALAKREAWAYTGGAEIWYGIVSGTGGTSVSIGFTGWVGYGAVADICEYTGLDTTAPLDKTAQGTGSGGEQPALTGTTATTTVADELWIGLINDAGGNGSSPQNGFTLLDGVCYNSNPSCCYLEKIVSATGEAYSGCNQAENGFAGVIATFIAGGPPPPPEPVNLTHEALEYLVYSETVSHSKQFHRVFTEILVFSAHISKYIRKLRRRFNQHPKQQILNESR